MDVGDKVRVVARKWGDRPHWECDARLLGADEHGTWLGSPAGTELSRPGVSFRSRQDFVTLFPESRWFTASFYGLRPGPVPDGWVEVYVDITTVPSWEEDVVTAVDLDLDVVRGRTGRVWVDDEDEFAEHRVRFGYPREIVDGALASCEEVRSAVTARLPPYDGVVGPAWLDRLTRSDA